MINIISLIEDRVNSVENITFEEALRLGNLEDEGDLVALYSAADRIRDRFNGKVVDVCSIMNAKSGRCPEDCKFCAQSAHYNTCVDVYGLVDSKSAVEMALENESCGVNRFSLVTSGRGMDEDELERVLKIYNELRKNVKIDLCASLGILSYEQLLKLRDTGVSMYHHNLETNREYYEKICTTHTYDERIETIKNAKKAGLRVCSGGIIGMGETMEDRIKFAFEIKRLDIKSIPINVLNPVKGTPFENMEKLSQSEILKTIAIFRFINPSASIRLAGGRNQIDDFGKGCFRAGANATISGNYLTTSGNKIAEDIKMIKSLDLEVIKND